MSTVSSFFVGVFWTAVVILSVVVILDDGRAETLAGDVGEVVAEAGDRVEAVVREADIAAAAGASRAAAPEFAFDGRGEIVLAELTAPFGGAPFDPPTLPSAVDGGPASRDLFASRPSLEEALSARSYEKLTVITADDDFAVVRACNGVRAFALAIDLDAAGFDAVVSRRALGFCDRVDDALLYGPPSDEVLAAIPVAGRLHPDACQAAVDALQSGAPITFDSAEADLTALDRLVVANIAAVLARCPDAFVLVDGHASTTGDAELNAALAEQRARRVQAALVAAGVAPLRVVAAGHGALYPRFPSEEDVELNRRIEINLVW